MGGLRKSNDVLLFKAESTYNTDPTPVEGTNAVLCGGVQMSDDSLRMVGRPAVRGSIGQLQKIYGGMLRRIAFQCEVKGSGAAGTAPEIGPILKACGMDETIVGATSVTYQPVSTSHASGTAYFFEGGRKRHILTGLRGNLSLSLEAGGILLADFDMLGHYTQATDQSQPSPTYSSQIPKPALGLTVSFNGVTTLVPRRWSLGLNNTLESGPSMAAADGYGDIIITGRDVMGEIEVESELDSVIDIDSLLAAGTKFAFSAGALGATGGNIVTVSTPSSSTYITGSNQGDGNGLRTRTVPFSVDDSTSDQEVSIAFT